jgi:hypothetical protein
MDTHDAFRMAHAAATRTAPFASCVLKLGINLAWFGLGVLIVTEALKGVAAGIDEIADEVNR